MTDDEVAYQTYCFLKSRLAYTQQVDTPEQYQESCNLVARYERKLIAEGREADIYTPENNND